MTQLQDQLKNVSKTLTSLSRQLEGISKKIAKVPATKSPARKKAVTKAKAKAKPKAKAKVKAAPKRRVATEQLLLKQLLQRVKQFSIRYLM